MRIALPWLFTRLIPKGTDCEAAGGQHQWYNQDGKNSACYHCRTVLPGHLWRK
jgi:hypothetical protein